MAESPAHRFGQIVGDLLEELLEPEFQRFCEERQLVLDRKGPRPAIRKGKKVCWEDKYGNKHDLDFVIEKISTDGKRGRPIAFIEAAWRRYTKHSRNKAQEIQGAIVPLAETHSYDMPFLGAVLAGEFTKGSLAQLKSHDFNIVHFSYADIIAAFASVDIDARFDEDTPVTQFQACILQIEGLAPSSRDKLKAEFLNSRNLELKAFFESLNRKLDRVVDRVIIVPLFGVTNEFQTSGAAAAFIESFDAASANGPFRKFEVQVNFSNGDSISGNFAESLEAIRFLRYVTS
jgi:hypothetical protein